MSTVTVNSDDRTGTGRSAAGPTVPLTAGRPVGVAITPSGEPYVPYLTVARVAARWGVSRSTVYTLVAGGQLPSVRIGLGRGTIRIREADAAAYLTDNARDEGLVFAEHFA